MKSVECRVTSDKGQKVRGECRVSSDKTKESDQLSVISLPLGAWRAKWGDQVNSHQKGESGKGRGMSTGKDQSQAQTESRFIENSD